MNRRTVLAGASGLATITGCLDEGDGTDETNGARPTDDGRSEPPFEISTIDAPDSDAGTITVPVPDRTLLLNFTRTECPTSEGLHPTIGDACDRLDEEHGVDGENGRIRFLSVIDRTQGPSPTADELAEWWGEHDGEWSIGIDDDGALSDHYEIRGFPTIIVLASDDTVHWKNRGGTASSTIVAAVEDALETEANDAETEANGDSNAESRASVP